MTQLGVVIPTVNEADQLPKLLRQLREQTGIELELVIADGGSSDATMQLARDAGLEVVESAPGRARQMNRGAEITTSPWLLFLHADSSFSRTDQLAAAVQQLKASHRQLGHQRVAGHFRLRFHRTRPGHDLAYRYYEEKSALNRPECTNGDQGLLLSRSFFDQLGGFDESLWFLEDQRMAEKIRRQGHWITLPGALGTSARRFEQEGLGRRMLLSAMIMNLHAMGLHEFFRRSRSIYRTQSHTTKLRLGPVFSLLAELNREAGPRISRRRWLASGRYACLHLWQLFFWLDIVLEGLGKRRRQLLPVYDRVIAPRTDNHFCHLAAGGVVWIWFHATRLALKIIQD